MRTITRAYPGSHSGTFTVIETTIQFTDAQGRSINGEVLGDVLTQNRGGVAWVYER
jgi:hypothetical protein